MNLKHKFILLLFLQFISCHHYSKDIRYALNSAGNNCRELEIVLNHYSQNESDSLKYRAACFLIENMPYHFSQEEYYLSPSGVKYRPDVASFNETEDLKQHCDSLLSRGYRIERHVKCDISSLDSKFLINNIDLAFEVWGKPWAKNVSFMNFCRYILPYRAQTEMSSYLRKEIMERFLPVLDSANVMTSLEACALLNEYLKDVIKYKDTGLSFYPTIDETYKCGFSRCEGMCNLGAFIMRAVGVPVAVDQTIWVRMDFGHSWCAVLDNGRFYSFGPGEDQPGVHARLSLEKRYRRPAKVYRSRFDPVFHDEQLKDDDEYSTFLKNPLLYDVTTEYLSETFDMQIAADKKKSNKNSDQVYLCVYNSYEWRPIAIGYRAGSLCHFEKDGMIHKFIPQMQYFQTFTMRKRKNKEDQEHTLSYWNPEEDRFVPLEYIESTDTTQIYCRIPGNALLWFGIQERILGQRVFYIENDSVKN